MERYVTKFGTQENVLESALENLENSSKQSKVNLTPEDKAWMRLKKENTICIIDKIAFKILIENANTEPLHNYFIQNRVLESRIELVVQKPIMELNLEELVIGIVTACKLVQWMDTVNYSENDIHYSLMLSHSLGPEISKTISESYQNMFKTYGIKAEITNSTKNIFAKIYKK